MAKNTKSGEVFAPMVKPTNFVANLSIPENCRNKGYEDIVQFLRSHPLHYALTAIPTFMYPDMLKEFWSTCKYHSSENCIIGSVCKGKYSVRITLDGLRDVLKLPHHKKYDSLVTKAQAKRFLNRVGYDFPTDEECKQLNITRGQIKKKRLPAAWSYLFGIVITSLGGKVGSYDQAGPMEMQILHSLVMGTNINYAEVIYNKLKKTVSERRINVPYTRFLSLVFQKTLGKKYTQADLETITPPERESYFHKDVKKTDPKLTTAMRSMINNPYVLPQSDSEADSSDSEADSSPHWTKATTKQGVKPKENQVSQGSVTRSQGIVTEKSKQEGNVKESKKSDKRKLVLNRDEPEDSDDSFETAMKKSREVVGAEPKWKKSKCLNKCEDYESLYVRNPPLELISIMKDFTVEQQNSVKKMGFESILGTSVGQIPNRLGFWLVENYDPDSNTLQTGNKSLLITRQTVHDVYGFPMGNTQINALKRTWPGNIVVKEFQNQFSTTGCHVRISDVLPELVKDVTGGRKFILNFLVSVMTVFLGGNTFGTVNQKFLPDIQADTDIVDLDWCTYALECLNSSRKSWDRRKEFTYFTGPLLLLVVFYASSTIVPGEIVERRFPLMNCWTTETLKKREAKEMIDGGFGKLNIADGVVLVDNDVDDEVSIHTVEEVLENEDMALCSGHNEAFEFIPESTLPQYPPKQPIDLSKTKFKNIIMAKSLHPTEFYGYTIRERFAKMGWEQLLDFDCDKIYRRIVIDWTTSLSRKGDELTGIVDGKPYTISPAIIRDLLKVDSRTDLPYARFNQADFQTITDENDIRWPEACKTVFGHELDKNVETSYMEMTPLVKILWGIGLWTFHPRLKNTNCVLAHEIYLLHALYTGEYLYSFAHLMIDDIWSMYEDEYQQTIPYVYYLSEILTRLGAVSQDERIEVVDLSQRQITRKSFRDLQFSESPTRYIIYDRVLKQQVTFLKKAIGVEAPPQSPPHLIPIPNPHADKTNNSEDLISTQLSQCQKQLDDMMLTVSNMQKLMEQQAFEAIRRDQERELLEQTREKRAQEREKQAEEREKQVEILAHTMESNLQNLIRKQFQEQYEKMTMIVNDKLKQMECHALKAERREEEREKQEQERERQAQIKKNSLQNMISKQFQEKHEKMIMLVNDMKKHMESQALAAECREQKLEKQEEEREKRADIRAHAIIWDVERQRYLYEQEQRELRMAWNQGNCVNAVDEFQFPQISHTSFHPPRVGSQYYDPTQSNEIPHAFRSLYHDIYGPRD